ncbi:MAG: hypothetical protein WCO35_01280 [Candidatus Nomurabacteria bacterium]
MCDKNCGMCIYFKYTTKGNWVKSGICSPQSGTKFNKDFFDESCSEFSPRLTSDNDDDDDFSTREAWSIYSSSLRSI